MPLNYILLLLCYHFVIIVLSTKSLRQSIVQIIPYKQNTRSLLTYVCDVLLSFIVSLKLLLSSQIIQLAVLTQLVNTPAS